MDSNTNETTLKSNLSSGALPPTQSSVPPLIGAGGVPPPLPGASSSKPSSLRRLVAILLSLCLLLFLADGFVSLLDDCLIVFFRVHPIQGLRGMISLLAVLAGIATYALMGLTP